MGRIKVKPGVYDIWPLVTSPPLVSIGMPVYNGEKYLRQALDSLLAQDYSNLALYISDNASTDGTPAICEWYCARDQRLHYYRNPTNLGILANWRRAFELAAGDLFMWAACDDCWSPNYLRTLVDCLLSNPQAILAAGRIRFMDVNGNLYAGHHNAPAREANGMLGPAKQLLWQHATNWLHGVYRKEALATFLPTFLTEDPWGSDLLFLLEICLAAEVVGSDEAIMYKRLDGHGPLFTPRKRVQWQWWLVRALLRRVLHSPLPLHKKAGFLPTCVFYPRFYFQGSLYVWILLWARASYHCLLGEDRP
jgi:glycosyltransferase involved in cell wall biosynthesis